MDDSANFFCQIKDNRFCTSYRHKYFIRPSIIKLEDDRYTL
jgi:hypothetical protein